MARIVGVILSDLDWMRLEVGSQEDMHSFGRLLRTIVGEEIEDLELVHVHRRKGQQWLQVERNAA